MINAETIASDISHKITTTLGCVTKMKRNGKYQYSVADDRIIYMIHSPHCNDFFIWHCKSNLWKSSYQRHIQGKCAPTVDFIQACNSNGYQPCFHILEQVHLTQVMAYKHVIAWTEILYRNGFEPLVGEKTLFRMTDMSEYTESVFNHNKNVDLEQLLSCDTCLFTNCAHKKRVDQKL